MAVTTAEKRYPADRRQEEAWRALPESEQPYLVVFFGMLGYEVVAVCDTEEEANEVLLYWQVCAVLGNLGGGGRYGLRLKGWTRCVSPHDLQVRQQHDLDALTRAILESYR